MRFWVYCDVESRVRLLSQSEIAGSDPGNYILFCQTFSTPTPPPPNTNNLGFTVKTDCNDDDPGWFLVNKN